MRRGVVLSLLLHLTILGWLLHGLAEAGGAPSLGNGGAAFEILVMSSAAGGATSPDQQAEEFSAAPPPAPKPGPEAEQ